MNFCGENDTLISGFAFVKNAPILSKSSFFKKKCFQLIWILRYFDFWQLYGSKFCNGYQFFKEN